MSFVYKSNGAVCNRRVRGFCQIELGSTGLLWLVQCMVYATIVIFFYIKPKKQTNKQTNEAKQNKNNTKTNIKINRIS